MTQVVKEAREGGCNIAIPTGGQALRAESAAPPLRAPAVATLRRVQRFGMRGLARVALLGAVLALAWVATVVFARDASGRWRPLTLPSGDPTLLQRLGAALPNAEGYFPEIEFALSTGPVAIDSWVVR